MKRYFGIFLLGMIFLGGCCCTQQYFPSDTPPPLPCCPEVPKPVKLALVLGGGGAKGLAHVGVLEVLEEANIKVDLIVGCSAGSIVGALYADNPCTSHLKNLLLNLRSDFLVDFDLWHAKYGLCQGRSLRKFLQQNLCANTFEQLQVPFFLVATDLYSSELITLGGGPLVPAIEASCSIPLVFVPVWLHGRAFVDGGVIDPCPVRVAQHFDAEIIIAVDLRGLLPKKFPTNLFEVASRSADISLLWQSEECVEHATVVVRPNLQGIGTFADNCNELIYRAGRTAALEKLPEILACIEKQRCQEVK